MGHRQSVGRCSCVITAQALLALVLLAALLSACAGGTHPPNTPAAPAGQVAESPMSGLPAPSTLPKQASQDGIGHIIGSTFVDSWPHERVSVDGSSGLYAPVAGNGLAAAAYAIYLVRISLPLMAASTAELGWGAGAIPSAGCWLALANWPANRWDWFHAADGVNVMLPSLANYLSPSGTFVKDVYCVVLLESGAPAHLNWLRLGPNMAPTGAIHSESGAAPRSLHLTLIPQDYDGSVTDVDWDFENDGVIDVQGAFDVVHTYAETGMYTIKAYLTDNDGATGSVTLTRPVSLWRIDKQPLATDWGAADALIDSAGNVHVALLRETADYQVDDLVYAQYLSGVWSEESVTPVIEAGQLQLALGPDGEPQILLKPDEILRRPLLYICHDAAGWHSSELTDSGYFPANSPTARLAIDSGGRALAAYLAWDEPGQVCTLRWSSSDSGWVFEQLPLPLGPDWGGQLALAFDAGSNAHLACGASESGHGFLYAVIDPAGSATTELVDGQYGYSGAMDIIVDAAGRVHVAYMGYDQFASPEEMYTLRHAVKEGGFWSETSLLISGVARFALDAGGEVIIAAGQRNGGDWGMVGSTSFAYSDGSQWQVETLEFLPGDGDGALYGVGLDPQGRPWMCYDGPQLRLATRLE